MSFFHYVWPGQNPQGTEPDAPDPRANPDDPEAPEITATQDAGLPAGAVPGGLTESGVATMRARMAPPDGDMWLQWRAAIGRASLTDHAIAIQTGYSEFNDQIVQDLINAGYTAAIVGGQILAAATPGIFWSQLPASARDALARWLAG